ncbi:hydroxymethylbilane synthase [bacterium]|nr:hydroxymethylbilane synthase [bacterium]
MTEQRKIKIATRKSALALWQANTVKSLLEQRGLQVELNLVVTSGDKMQRGALADISLDDPNLPAHLKTGKGLFVKEVQEEILANRADLAVHSMKDLPVETTLGLHVAAVLPRANPCDVIIFSPPLRNEILSQLKIKTLADVSVSEVLNVLKNRQWTETAKIGTTSARRQTFLRNALSPSELPLVVLRGNVDTRLNRVANNEFAFIMLARAGLDRLGLYNPETMITLPETLSTPAPAQGVVAIECRAEDTELRAHLASIHCPITSLQAAFERASLWLTGGNCQTALAAHHFGHEILIWAAKDGLLRELQFELFSSQQESWHNSSLQLDHGELFKAFLRSPLALRLHAELLQSRFADLMTLRTPLGTIESETSSPI